jgi:hypothetical protein
MDAAGICNAEVWKEVQGQATGAGFGGSLSDFLKSCNIPVAGKGC